MAKRQAADMQSVDNNTPIFREDIDILLGDLRGDLKNALTKQLKESANALHTVVLDKMSNAIRRVDDNLHKRLDEHEKRIKDNERNHAQLSRTVQALLSDVESLKKGLCLAQKGVPDLHELESQSWDRQTSKTIIKVSANNMVSRDAVSNGIKEWMDNSATPDGWKLSGESLGKQFTIRLLGEPGLAFNRCRKALEALRREDGTWRETKISSPTNVVTPLYFEVDKNAKTMCEEGCLRKLKRLVSEQTDQDVHLSRRDRLVSIRWQPLVTVSAASRDDITVKWHNEVLQKINLDKGALLNKFDEGSQRSLSEIPWSL